MIKHLVLSGGSWKGLYMTGAIDKLMREKIFELENIESIWATSVGTVVAVLLALNIEWDMVIKYFINVPIRDFDNMKLDNYVSMFNECGILNKTFFTKLLGSLFKSKYLNIEEITLLDFYKYSKIEINFFAIEFETIKTEIFNYKKYPNIKLLDAIYCSCTFPYLFKPAKINDIVYLDGGLNVHYPSTYCLNEHNNDEIFGIYIKTDNSLDNNMDNMLYFGINLIYKLIFTRQMINLEKLNHQIVIKTECKMANKILELVKNKKMREEIINKGKIQVENYLNDRI
tara:strand:- start:363 stop:1217 length:855 start_codon:yes stop_codon:yes gene_type:complete